MGLNDSIEKHQFKISTGIALAALIFIITMTSNISRWQEQQENRIVNLEDKLLEVTSQVKDLDDKANNRDIQLATINTQLAQIQATLYEIKADIKNA